MITLTFLILYREEVVMLKPKELEVLLEMRTMGSQPLCVHVIRDPDNPTKRKFTYSTGWLQENAVDAIFLKLWAHYSLQKFAKSLL